MLDLIAIGPDPPQRRRFNLPDRATLTLGRATDAELHIDWEPVLSRRHVELAVDGDQVRVRQLEQSRNPVFHQGQAESGFVLREDDAFTIGSTIFRLARTGGSDSSPQDQVLEEVRFEVGQLRNVPFSDADKRIEVLTHLPQVILGTRTEDDFLLRTAQLLLAGIPRAESVAIVSSDESGVRVLHWDRRHETRGDVRPSTRLVREALVSSGHSVLHVWEPGHEGEHRYTITSGCNWAFCTPVIIPGEPRRGLYVTGQLDPVAAVEASGEPARLLQADVRFTELVAEIVSSLRRLSALERHQAGLRQFFAPPILEALGEDFNTDILAPRECEVTVLFCDLRGFSQQAEHAADDLEGLLGRVSQALGTMTSQILRFGGVTGDFQGDAALGFWGWPFPSGDAPLNACRAALGIRRAFEAASIQEGHPLSDFRMGIGIAHGRAVAGKIGTSEQVKVTVFGPVVNLASRLESMTSQLRAPILMDDATAALVREHLDRSEGRARRLGRVLPIGMETPVLVSELLPPESQYPLLTDEHITRYEEGVEHFMAGRWDAAWQCLHHMPAGDRAQDFLAMPIVQHNRQAPADWDGVVRLNRK